jgi:site-specific DNA-methyltransferase (adenine-specific)
MCGRFTLYRLIEGDCLQVLPTIPDESIDMIVTDPPYGISFMGKNWDRTLPPKKAFSECLRVLKNGAFAFVMCSPRQDVMSRMIMMLDDVGFNIGFTSIYWTYASGFPKSMNISKAIDRRECKKQLTDRLGRKPTKEEFEEAWKTFRNVVGKSARHNGRSFGSGVGDEQYGTYKGGIPNLTVPATSQAKVLDGSYGGFQPKSAVEVILVAMKPLSEKTYIDQALKNGKGVTWLDSIRIPINPKIDDILREVKREKRISETWEKGSGFKNEENPLTGVRQEGRFPANLICSDNVLDDGKITNSHGHFSYKWKKNPYNGGWKAHPEDGYYCSDVGSFSRYFDLDKWFDEKFKQLPKNVQRTFPFLIVPKASKSEREKGLETMPKQKHLQGLDTRERTLEREDGSKTLVERWQAESKNIHPTVKPLRLFSYLIALGSRQNDLVLDPFIGSGTTMLSALMMSRRCVGIEIDEEYCRIADARIKGTNDLQLINNYSFEVFKK